MYSARYNRKFDYNLELLFGGSQLLYSWTIISAGHKLGDQSIGIDETNTFQIKY